MTLEEASDAELLDALRQGGEPRARAWAVLVARHSPRLYAVARSFAFDAQTAEDVVQTAWLRLIERVEQLRDPDALGPWLATIVRNQSRSLVTRRRAIPTGLDVDEASDLGPNPGAGVIEDERAAALRLAFSRLEEDCRQLLRLMFADPPLSYDEIAAATGRPRGSLGPTRRRCLDRLRAWLPPGFEP